MRRPSARVPGATPAGRVLVVEYDATVRALLRAVLATAGYAVLATGDGPTALALLVLVRPDAVVLDPRLPSLDGHAFARAYRRLPGPHASLVVLSADADGPAQARRLGATYVGKPADVGRLLAAVGRAARRGRAAA